MGSIQTIIASLPRQSVHSLPPRSAPPRPGGPCRSGAGKALSGGVGGVGRASTPGHRSFRAQELLKLKLRVEQRLY
jgi:hypothetical protein